MRFSNLRRMRNAGCPTTPLGGRLFVRKRFARQRSFAYDLLSVPLLISYLNSKKKFLIYFLPENALLISGLLMYTLLHKYPTYPGRVAGNISKPAAIILDTEYHCSGMSTLFLWYSWLTVFSPPPQFRKTKNTKKRILWPFKYYVRSGI